MKVLLIIAIVVLMGFVVLSLVRGIATFLKSTRTDLENHTNDDGPSPMQLRQNEAMFARVKYQALAVIVVVILLAISRA